MNYLNMAAHMRKICHAAIVNKSHVFAQTRGARSGYMRRNPIRLITPDEEYRKLREHGVQSRDPRKDVNYIPGEPVMENLKPRLTRKIDQIAAKDVHHTDQHMATSYTTGDTLNIFKKKGEKLINDLNITRLPDHDNRIVRDISNAKSKKVREKERLFFVEGSKLISEALECGLAMKALYFAQNKILQELPLNRSHNIYQVSNHQIKLWSDLSTPQGIMAIFKMPLEGDSNLVPKNSIPVTVVLHRITDPEHMGSLIKMSASIGCQRLLILSRCVDIWESKVLVTAGGSHFRIPIITNIQLSDLPNYLNQSSVFITTNRKSIQESLQREITERNDPVETALLLDQLDSKTSADSNDSDKEDDSDSEGDRLFNKAPLSVNFYNNVDYTNQSHAMIIISGENKRFPAEIRKFLYQNYAECVVLPMNDGTKSLNSTITGSVVLCEVHKQFTEKSNKTPQ